MNSFIQYHRQSLLFAPLLFPRVGFRKDAFARKVLRPAADLTLLSSLVVRTGRIELQAAPHVNTLTETRETSCSEVTGARTKCGCMKEQR